MQVLAFHNTQFDIVDRDGQPWLQAAQIAKALGYANDNAISRIFSRNADEFTPCMTEKVNLTLSGNLQKEVRIFSLRGAHLLAMFARTKVAKEFRRWVLDVLEGIVEAPAAAKAKRQPKALPNGLTLDQQAAIKGLVKARVETLPKTKQAKAAITCWSALKSKFGCTYKEIEPAQFTDAISLVARLPLEGEWLEAERPATQQRLDIHYPLSMLLTRRPGMIQPFSDARDQISLTLRDFTHRHSSPCEDVLSKLTNAGYDVQAAWLEVRTYRNKIEKLIYGLRHVNEAFENPQDFLL